MYAAVPDPYCHPGTTVLINRLGFRNEAKLEAFEAEVSAVRATQPFPAGRLSFAHYRAIRWQRSDIVKGLMSARSPERPLIFWQS